MRIPKYRKHSQRDFAFVAYRGKRHRLPGSFNSKESIAAYWAFIQRHFGVIDPSDAGIRLDELTGRFLVHCQTWYGLKPRSTYFEFKRTCELLVSPEPIGEGFAGCPVDAFGPKTFKAWRERLIERKLARTTINKHAGRVKQMFRWAASEQLIKVDLYQALSTVGELPKNRTAARETEKRKPVSWEVVEPVISKLAETPATMLYLQWLTGCRSGSLVQAKPEQFSQDGLVLLWKPRHKMEHADVALTIPIGPIGQLVLTPFLARTPSHEYIFRPRDGNRNDLRYNECYSPWTYRKRLVRVMERHNLQQWTPHQLRHARAQMIRNAFGIEAAQALLGHESLSTTQLYSSKRLELAKDVALSIG